MLKAIDLNKPITEDYFNSLCETPLKHNMDAMCGIVQIMFPTATDIKYGANYIGCKISNFSILVPTSRIKGVNL